MSQSYSANLPELQWLSRSNGAPRKRILITGGSGTLGYNILLQLASLGCYRIIAPMRTRLPFADELGDSVQFIHHDLNDAIHTAQIVERFKPDVIVHCAASGLRLPKHSWFDLMHFNVETTMRLFQMNCRFDHESHFIYISTGLVYREQGRPLLETDPLETLHPYGASKAASDVMLQAAAVEFDRRLTILRPFAFTGVRDGGQRLFPLLLHAASEGTPLPMTEGKQIRDFSAARDIARAVTLVIKRPQARLIEKFNLGSGRSLPLRELVEEVCSDLGLQVKINAGAIKMNPYEPMHLVAGIEQARELLGWEPQIKLSQAVWELAREMYPVMNMRQP